MDDDGRIYYSIEADTKGLEKGEQRTKQAFRNIAGEATRQSAIAKDAFASLQKQVAGVLTVAAVSSFIKKVVSVRAEIQSLSISFETLLNSKQKADALMQQLKTYAVSTPMQLKDLAAGAQQLLSFGIQAGKVMPILKALGDISMGDSQKFQSLTLAFSQATATGKLMGQDLLQMINAGFNPLTVISQQTGKSIGQLKDEMGKGAISARMLEEAFLKAAGAGGQFNGMLLRQSEGIQGAISNLQGALDDMFNDFGEAGQGAFSSLVNTATLLVKNYKAVGQAIAEMIALYGVYRTALATTMALETLHTMGIGTLTAAERLHYAWLVLQTKAQAALNAVMSTNPYVLLAAAVAGLSYAVYKLATSETEAEQATRMLDDVTHEMNVSLAKEEAQMSLMFSRLQAARKGTKEYQEAKDAILNKYGAYLKGLGREVESLNDVAGAYRAIRNAAVEAAKARAIESATTTAAQTYAEKQAQGRDRIYATLKRHYGNAKSGGVFLYDKMMSQIGGAIDGNGTVITKRFLDKFTRTDYASTGSASGLPTRQVAMTSNPLREALDGIKRAKQQYDNTIAEAERRFGKYKPLKEELPVSAGTHSEQAKAGAKAGKRDDQQQRLAKQEEQREQQIQQNAKAEVEAMQEAEADIQEAEAQLQDNALTRALMQNENAYQQRMRQIDRQRKAFIGALKDKTTLAWQQQHPQEAAKGGKPDVSGITAKDLTKEQQDVLAKQEEQARRLREKADKEAIRNSLDGVRTYEQQRLAIEEEYQKKRQNLYVNQDRHQGYIAGASQDNEAELDRQLKEALERVDEQFASRQTTFTSWAKSVASLSLKQLDKMLLEAKLRLKKAERDGSVKGDDLALLRSKVAALEKQQQERKDDDEAADERQDKDKKKFTDNLGGLFSLGKKNQQDEKKSAFENADTVIHGINDNAQSMAAMLQQMGLADTDFAKHVEMFAQTSQEATAAFDSLKSGDVAGTIGHSLGAVGGMLETIGLAGESDKHLAQDIVRLTQSNDDLRTAIDNLADKMDEASVSDMADIYSQQLAMLKQSISNTQEMMSRTLAAAKSGINGKHSSAKKMGQGLSDEDWARLEAVTGKHFNKKANRLFDSTTPEDFYKIQTELPDLYTKLKMLARAGYKDASVYMDDFASYYTQLKELEQQVRENLTNVSFDSVVDTFKSRLEDMSSLAGDFSEDLAKYLNSAIVNSFVSEHYKKRLEQWYEGFAKDMEDGRITSGELSTLKGQYDKIVSDALLERNKLLEAGILTDENAYTQQSASRGGFANMSEETANELNGRFTALQISNQQIADIAEQINQRLNDPMFVQTKEQVQDLRDIAFTSMGYLNTIAENTAHLLFIREHLEKIERNTDNL